MPRCWISHVKCKRLQTKQIILHVLLSKRLVRLRIAATVAREPPGAPPAPEPAPAATATNQPTRRQLPMYSPRKETDRRDKMPWRSITPSSTSPTRVPPNAIQDCFRGLFVSYSPSGLKKRPEGHCVAFTDS